MPPPEGDGISAAKEPMPCNASVSARERALSMGWAVDVAPESWMDAWLREERAFRAEVAEREGLARLRAAVYKL